ncbi:hypothetical protein QCE49_04390 [Caballeronia sp. LZ008]|nr:MULTISPECIES: hypothetical protein [unclassified Caballeronia]MDR5792613.1 hypothetical protein [Caballeronia sp. LZ008]
MIFMSTLQFEDEMNRLRLGRICAGSRTQPAEKMPESSDEPLIQARQGFAPGAHIKNGLPHALCDRPLSASQKLQVG